MRIVAGGLDHPAVIALLEHHFREAHRHSPPGSAFVLDLSALRDPALSVSTAWDGDTLLGIGALKRLGEGEGEIKSMRTAPGQERRGVARAMLRHLLGEAQGRGDRTVWLETGTNVPYAAARALYESEGFVPSGPFGDYALTEFNQCYTLRL